jgi:glutamine synthetase
MLTERGVWRIDSGVEATKRLTAEKNIELFGKLGVLSEVECKAREHILHEHYAGTVEIEAGSMIDMIQQHVIPSCNAAGLTETVPLLEKAIETIKSEMHKIEEIESAYETAQLSRTLRLETMVEIRKLCDAAEKIIPSELWTLATYKDLLFLDPNLDHPAAY